jgi:tetraacyldisaccharide 4'-kinase
MNGFFAFISLIYQGGCQLKNILYRIRLFRPKTAPIQVISIGNIAFGGSEKTPLAMAVIEWLLSQNHKPALVTRGYKGKWEKKGGILSDGKQIFGQWTDSGDEAFMVAWNFPEAGVFVGKNRLASCQKASQLGFETALLDDGFQHRKLHRDLDIVLHSPRKHLPLREPVSTLKRAHVLLLKEDTSVAGDAENTRGIPGLKTYTYTVKVQGFFRLADRIRADTEVLKAKKVVAFCGIARPERFFEFLKSAGIKPCSLLVFADHHAYPFSTQEKLIDAFQAHQADVFVTTEKDAVKIKGLDLFQDRPVYYMKIGLKIEDSFRDLILSHLRRTKSNFGKDAVQSR